ncbi:MAG: BspA family leucine-rich repeat surface protein [Bacteroidales bacterium]|nr:BspA family leucine-rich repeat surface protein [Bacteroidales bacterium]
MRKLFIFSIVLAGITMMVGCQKEQDGISLKAVISNDSKTYIGTDNYPFWESGDEVNINGREYPLTNISGTFARINNVQSEAPFCAVFPASIVHPASSIAISDDGNTTNPTYSATATIYLEPHQNYIDENGYQKLDMPMAALTTGTTLYFKNFCSVIRVKITNGLGSDDEGFDVRSITIKANGAYLAGYASATITESEVSLSFANQPSLTNTITLSRPNNTSMGQILPGDNGKTFDIIVPPFTMTSNQDLTFIVETTNRGNYTHSVTNAHLTSSQIAPISFSVDNLTPSDRAYLLPGDDFNDLIDDYNISTIQFVRGYWSLIHADNKIILSTDDSPNVVWGLVQGTTLKIFSEEHVPYIYANPDSKGMFEDLANVSSLQLGGDQERIYFLTDLVTDMSFMFAGCTSLSSSTFSGIEHFNTSNVTTMAHMFDGCSSSGLSELDLSHFDTHHLFGSGMVAMFNGCASMRTLDLSSFTSEQITDMTDLFNGCTHMTSLDLSNFDMSRVTDEDNTSNMCLNLGSQIGTSNRCTITCPEPVESKLSQSVTGINLDNVVFVRP